MIYILKKMLHEGLAEMQIKQKDLFGSGMEHKIFPSKDPNKLFKVGYCHSVKLFIKAATKNNKYFPIVYKIGDMMYKGERVCWVLIEKLNTDKAIADWQKLEMALEEIGLIEYSDVNELPSNGGYADLGYLFRDVLVDNDLLFDVYEYLKRYNKDMYNLFKQWFKTLNACEKIVLNFKNSLDIHMYNFGYDNAGNLKCLDI